MSGRLSARNDGFQKDLVTSFDERHEVCVTLNQDDRDLLAGIARLVRVLEQIDLIARLNVEYHVLE